MTSNVCEDQLVEAFRKVIQTFREKVKDPNPIFDITLSQYDANENDNVADKDVTETITAVTCEVITDDGIQDLIYYSKTFDMNTKELINDHQEVIEDD